MANEYLAAQGRPPGFSVRTLAVTREVRLDDGRITVQADAVLDEAGVDICIAPPLLGSVSDVVLNNRALIEWLARHRGGGEVASLCMGAALLAAGGLLDGQEAVVHWAAQGMYAQLFPEVQWVSDRVVAAGEGIHQRRGFFGRAPGAAPDRAPPTATPPSGANTCSGCASRRQEAAGKLAQERVRGHVRGRLQRHQGVPRHLQQVLRHVAGYRERYQ